MSSWNHWERRLREVLEHPDLLDALNQHQELNGYEKDGRITYMRIANKKSFNVFSDAVYAITPLDKVLHLPSIAKVVLGKEAWVYNEYFIQYTDFDVTSSVSLPTPSRSNQIELDELMTLLDEKSANTPLIGICILEIKATENFHGIAFIAWRDDIDEYHFAYYDPNAYHRTRNGKVTKYDYAQKAFHPNHFSTPITFHDLSAFCLKLTDVVEDFHCPQYVMDADYCYLYALYFLCKWIDVGKPLDMEGLRSAVKATYIVDPLKLTRASTRESMTYRVVMMSFVLTVLVRYLKGLTKKQRQVVEDYDQHLQEMLDFNEEWIRSYGFPLMKPYTRSRTTQK